MSEQEAQPTAQPKVEPKVQSKVEQTATAEAATPSGSILGQANQAVSNYTKAAVGVGLIPAPLLDTVLVSAVQIKMLRRIATLYDQKLSEHQAEIAISSLLALVVPLSLRVNLFSLVKGIPFVGQTVGILGMSVFSGASTYALGKVFIEHFACGGTLLSFDPERVKGYYQHQFEQGKQVVKTKNYAGVKP